MSVMSNQACFRDFGTKSVFFFAPTLTLRTSTKAERQTTCKMWNLGHQTCDLIDEGSSHRSALDYHQKPLNLVVAEPFQIASRTTLIKYQQSDTAL
jgi:hypothetical protein